MGEEPDQQSGPGVIIVVQTSDLDKPAAECGSPAMPPGRPSNRGNMTMFEQNVEGRGEGESVPLRFIPCLLGPATLLRVFCFFSRSR